MRTITGRVSGGGDGGGGAAKPRTPAFPGRHAITVHAPLPAPTTRCEADAGLPPLLPARAAGPGWLPDLAAAAAADSFPALRRALSGRPPPVVPADLAALLTAYTALHADILSGTAPLRVFIVRCRGEPSAPGGGGGGGGGGGVGDAGVSSSGGEECGGLGDRLKSLRLFFYLCLLSGRALLLADDWSGVRASAVFAPAGVPDLYLTPGLLARVPALGRPNGTIWYGRGEMLLHTDEQVAARFVGAAFSDSGVVEVHASKNPLAVLAAATRLAQCPASVMGRLPAGSAAGGSAAPLAAGVPLASGEGTLGTAAAVSAASAAEAAAAAAAATAAAGGGAVAAAHAAKVVADAAQEDSPEVTAALAQLVFGGAWQPGPQATCATPRALDAVFGGPAPLSTAVAMDFLFRPHPKFLSHSLVPLAAALPAWNAPGPRVGVHIRTFALDQKRWVLCVPGGGRGGVGVMQPRTRSGGWGRGWEAVVVGRCGAVDPGSQLCLCVCMQPDAGGTARVRSTCLCDPRVRHSPTPPSVWCLPALPPAQVPVGAERDVGAGGSPPVRGVRHVRGGIPVADSPQHQVRRTRVLAAQRTTHPAAHAHAHAPTLTTGRHSCTCFPTAVDTRTHTRTHTHAHSVFLLSDKVDSLGLASYLPRGTVSSPLALDGGKPPIHVDYVGGGGGDKEGNPAQLTVDVDDALHRLKAVYAEAILLSAVDAGVHSLSGFSLLALQWGGLPPASVRLLPRFPRDLAGRPLEACGPGSYIPEYYRIFRDARVG
jgi:hypothetical protein